MHESLPTQTKSQEQAPSPFEMWLVSEFPKQYEARAKALDRLGLLRILPESGMYGIVDAEGNECPFPEMEDIKAKMLENKEFFEKKASQGFTRLQITPFGLPTKRLFDTIKKELVKHKTEGTLLSTNGDPLELDENDPLYAWDGYENQETRYFPEVFDKNNHGGKTKKEILEGKQSFPGFLVSFVEEDLDIPREGKGETIGGRKRIETNKTPHEYLKLLQENEVYRGESGITIEEWATLFLTTLREENKVIDDYQGRGSLNYNLGTYFPVSGFVSGARWYRDDAQAYVDRYDVGDRLGCDGSRIAVRV